MRKKIILLVSLALLVFAIISCDNGSSGAFVYPELYYGIWRSADGDTLEITRTSCTINGGSVVDYVVPLATFGQYSTGTLNDVSLKEMIAVEYDITINMSSGPVNIKPSLMVYSLDGYVSLRYEYITGGLTQTVNFYK